MKIRINDGHYLELMDRIHILMGTLYDHMIEHPISKSNPKVSKRLNKSLNLLWDTYQIVGEISSKKQEKNEPISKIVFRRRKKSKN